MIRIAVSILLLALSALAQEAKQLTQEPAQAQRVSCTDDSVTAEQMAAGGCDCPVSEDATPIVAEFKWSGGSGSFNIPTDYASVFNWWSSKFCHKYGVATIPLRNEQGELIKVNNEVQTIKVKLPKDKWTMQLWYTHNLETLVTPLNKACAADPNCASKIPSIKQAQDKLKAAQAEAEAADKAAAINALQPKVN